MNEEAARRVASDLGHDVIERLAMMPGADLTTAMIEVSRRRAEALSPADIVRRYHDDRFVGPGSIDPAAIRATEAALFDALPAGFEEVSLSPVVPFGTHAMGGVAESRVIPTIRNTEVAADPTNGLALEAAARRRDLLRADPRSGEPVRLAASQRITRAQTFEGPVSFAHFAIFGLVTAGRDTGDLAFEREAVALMISGLGVERLATLSG